MTRTITPAAEAASLADTARPVALIDLDFSSGVVRVNSTKYAFSYGGHVYLGAGHVGEISAAEEGIDIQASQLALKLNGIPRDYVSLALAEHYQGRSANLMLGLMDADHQIVLDPVTVFAGRMDVMAITLGLTASVTVTVESRFADWERARTRRYTTEDQAIDFPGDKLFDYSPTMVDKTVKWGRQ